MLIFFLLSRIQIGKDSESHVNKRSLVKVTDFLEINIFGLPQKNIYTFTGIFEAGDGPDLHY